MKAEDFIKECYVTMQCGMNEYMKVVSLDNALHAIKMAKKEVLDKIEKELKGCDFNEFPKESKQSLSDLIRFMRDV